MVQSKPNMQPDSYRTVPPPGYSLPPPGSIGAALGVVKPMNEAELRYEQVSQIPLRLDIRFNFIKSLFPLVYWFTGSCQIPDGHQQQAIVFQSGQASQGLALKRLPEVKV